MQNRRLQHAVLDPRLDRLATISTVKKVNTWYNDLSDHGATTLFHKLTPHDLGLYAQRDRAGMALFLLAVSPKLQFLLGHVSKVAPTER